MRSSTRERSAVDIPEDVVDYRSMVVDSVDVNVVAGIDGKLQYVSPACHRLFGWTPSELEGHHEDEFVHPHDLPLLHAARVKLASSPFVSTNYRFLCRDGTTRWTETTLAASK